MGEHQPFIMSCSIYTTIFFVFLIASPILAAPEIKAVEDRSFCMLNAPTTCANSCAGVDCSQTCTVVCGFWYFYRRICSNVPRQLVQQQPQQPPKRQIATTAAASKIDSFI